MYFIWFFSFSIILSFLAIPYFVDLLKRAKYYKKNHRGEKVLNSAGIIIPFIIFLSLSFILLIQGVAKNIFQIYMLDLIYLIIILSMGLGTLGFIDDLWGDRKILGFKGHFKELIFKGKLTTGALKAIGGGAICIVISKEFSTDMVSLIVNAVILAFFVNFINLMDVKPGRAIKMFLFLGMLGFCSFIYISYNGNIILNIASSIWVIWGLILGPLIALFVYELKEIIMLGDAGSNIMGGILGITFLSAFHQPTIRFVVLGILFIIHVYAEKKSISDIINNVAFLKNIDEMGRKK